MDGYYTCKPRDGKTLVYSLETGWSSPAATDFSTALPIYRGLDAVGLTYDIAYYRTDQWGNVGQLLTASSFPNVYQHIFFMFNQMDPAAITVLNMLLSSPSFGLIYGCSNDTSSSSFQNWLQTVFTNLTYYGLTENVTETWNVVSTSSSLTTLVPTPYSPLFTIRQACLNVNDPSVNSYISRTSSSPNITFPGLFSKSLSGSQIFFFPLGPYYDYSTTGTDRTWVDEIMKNSNHISYLF